ncbi:unnamed protein product [Amaranthus hypochondriacus]
MGSKQVQHNPIDFANPCENSKNKSFLPCPVASGSCKRPRGRPKTKGLQQLDTQTSAQPMSRSLMEAQNTWNEAKLLGISSSDENAVIAHLRKSKRLLILEEEAP